MNAAVRTIATLLGALLLATGARAQAGETAKDAAALANTRFEEAEGALADDPSEARALLDEAAGLYRRAIELGGAEAGLHYNLGNALLLKGEVGRAIAEYHRAGRLAGYTPEVRNNLAIARARVPDPIDEADAGLWNLAKHAWGSIPARARFHVFAGAFALAWALLAVRLWSRAPRGVLTLACVSAGLSLVCLVSLVAERFWPPGAVGVVVRDGADARTGPGEGAYSQAFDRPLPQGIEFEPDQRRGDWLRARFGDGSTAWVRTADVELID